MTIAAPEFTVDLETSTVTVERPLLEVTVDGGITGQGPPGPVGPPGTQGAVGPVGPAGANGTQGVPGTPGAPGATGPQGVQGPQGAQGVQGVTGPEGPAGGAFLRANWQFNINPAPPPGNGQLRTSEPIANAYFSEEDADGFNRQVLFQQVKIDDLIQVNGSDGTTAILRVTGTPVDNGTWWDFPVAFSSGDVTGKKGQRVEVLFVVGAPTGPQGPQGIQGIPGPTGPQGIPGAPGATGATGSQGIPGTTGVQGPQGIQGVQGPAGVVANPLSLPSATGQVTSITVVDDGSGSGTWPNRWEWKFDPVGAAPVTIVQWVNEFGEWRGTPAKANTVGWRAHARNQIGDTPHVGYIADVELARNDATVLWGLTEAGQYLRGTFTRRDAAGTDRDQPVFVVGTTAPADTTAIWIDTS